MTATYRYLLCDLLTNKVNLELPLQGVTYGRRLCKPGNTTFSYALSQDTSSITNQDVLEATIPGRTALYIDRNGQLVWGGIVWSRTYESEGQTVQFTGQSFESYFYKQFIESSVGYVNIDQRDIIRRLIVHMQSKSYAAIGIQTPTVYNGGILRTVDFTYYTGWSYGKAIEYMTNYAAGVDYTIEVYYDSNGNPAKRLVSANVLSVSIDQTQLVLDYPGSIKNYYYPENASASATTVVAFGAGEGSAIIRDKATNQTLLNTGYPDIQFGYTNKDVSVQATLASLAVAEAVRLVTPVTIPTFNLRPDTDPEFGSWNLGDYALIHIDDPYRFPEGKSLYVRITGYDVGIGDEGETLKIITANEENSS